MNKNTTEERTPGCKKCFAPTRYDTQARNGFCGWCAKVLTGEEIRAENEWEEVCRRIDNH